TDPLHGSSGASGPRWLPDRIAPGCHELRLPFSRLGNITITWCHVVIDHVQMQAKYCTTRAKFRGPTGSRAPHYAGISGAATAGRGPRKCGMTRVPILRMVCMIAA